MEKYTATRSFVKIAKDDILKISNEARLAKKNYASTIDASIGVFLSDEGRLEGVNNIKKSLALNIPLNLSYPSTIGSNRYKSTILNWLFREYYSSLTENYLVPFGATMGGTGACSIAFKTYLEEGETVLLPSIMWSNYKLIASNAGLKYDTYDLFNEDGKFNIYSLQKKIEEYQLKQKNVLVVINDPCQNPTGYSLNEEEYIMLINELNKLTSNGNITILFDIAYIDYDIFDSKAHRIFKTFATRYFSFLPLFGFSCSKTFGIYALRLGALFALTKDEEISSNFISAFEAIARGTYSCPNGAAIEAINLALEDHISKKSIEEEIRDNSLKLKARGEHLTSLLDKYHLTYLPYRNGFFVTIKVMDAHYVAGELKKQHIFVVPLTEKYIRIALSGINIDNIDILAYQLSEVIKNA